MLTNESVCLECFKVPGNAIVYNFDLLNTFPYTVFLNTFFLSLSIIDILARIIPIKI